MKLKLLNWVCIVLILVIIALSLIFSCSGGVYELYFESAWSNKLLFNTTASAVDIKNLRTGEYLHYVEKAGEVLPIKGVSTQKPLEVKWNGSWRSDEFDVTFHESERKIKVLFKPKGAKPSKVRDIRSQNT